MHSCCEEKGSCNIRGFYWIVQLINVRNIVSELIVLVFHFSVDCNTKRTKNEELVAGAIMSLRNFR